jgi:hypothetical protein
MPQPELKADDVFHVIGFTYQDVLSGVERQLIDLFEVPAHPSETRLVEVYFAELFSAPDIAAFTHFGNFLVVYFYSDTALALSKNVGLRLPPVIARIARAELPRWVATSISMLHPAERETSPIRQAHSKQRSE